jgi:hypothetical protein
MENDTNTGIAGKIPSIYMIPSDSLLGSIY